jgi:hypothetical protein
MVGSAIVRRLTALGHPHIITRTRRELAQTIAKVTGFTGRLTPR